MLYDLLIIGGSAAATTAAIYAVRQNLNFKMITKNFGGEVLTSGEIGNWPGGGMTDGIKLTQQFRDHLTLYGVQPEEGVQVNTIRVQPDGTFAVGASVGGKDAAYNAKTVIVATGVHPKELDVPGEREYRTKGVSYCTICDGPLFGGKTVVTVGGGNSALESALFLADIATRVYVINKNPQFKGEQVLLDKLMQKKNAEIIYTARTTKISGEKFVKALTYVDPAGKDHEIAVDGVFVHIGHLPNSTIVPDGTAKNEFNQLIVNANCETNIPGLYAAGDVTDVPFKQIVVAAGQGSIATLSAVQYLNRKQ